MPAADGFPPPQSRSILFGLSQRLLPQNSEAEQALLGAILANNRAYERVSGFLRPDHFADPIHGRIFEEISRRIEGGEHVDVVTLRTSFSNSGVLDEVGGPTYLAELLSAMVGIINAGEYGRLIVDCAMRRELIDRGEELVNLAFGGDTGLDAHEITERHLEALNNLGSVSEARQTMVPIGRAVADAIALSEQAFESGGILGMSLGLPTLDDALGGVEGGSLVILAGRPGMGKTAALCEIVLRITARRPAPESEDAMLPGAKVGVISLEMGAAQLARRLIAAEANINYEALRRGFVFRHQHLVDRMHAAGIEIGKRDILIEEAPGLRVGVIQQRARAIRRNLKGLDILFIDHLHLIGRGDTASRHGDTQAVSEATGALKALAKELQCPVVLLSQLNRDLEKRDDKRPTLSDLRQSGSIEQDADVVMFLHRPDYFLGDEEPEKRMGETEGTHATRVADWRVEKERVAGLLEVVLAKNREGRGNQIVKLFWAAQQMRVLDPNHDRLPMPGQQETHP